VSGVREGIDPLKKKKNRCYFTGGGKGGGVVPSYPTGKGKKGATHRVRRKKGNLFGRGEREETPINASGLERG